MTLRSSILCLLVYSLSSLNSLAIAGVEKRCSLFFSTGDVLREVRLAETQEQQLRGLSGQRYVESGMLFTFPRAQKLVFWMRDTPTALSVGFFDHNGVLFQIEDMRPNSSENHFSSKPAKDALELAQGQFQALGLGLGSQIIRRDCR